MERMGVANGDRTRVIVVLPLIAGLALAGCGSSSGGDPCAGMTDTGQSMSGNNTCRILAGACPHLGSDTIHNICADALPPNVAWDKMFLANNMLPNLANPPNGRAGQGCDVSLEGREYDALSWDSQMQTPTVWEVKTDNWSHDSPGLQTCILQRFIKLYLTDCGDILQCNQGIMNPSVKIHYSLALSDHPLYDAVNQYFANNPSALPSGAADYCAIFDAQACSSSP